MKLTLLLALTGSVIAQSAERVVLFDELVRIPRSQWRGLTPVVLRQRPAIVEVDYTVMSGGAEVRAVVMTRQEVARFRDGHSPRAVAATQPSREGKLRHLITRPGDYVVLLDNRTEQRGGAAVQLKVGLAYHPQHVSFTPGRLPEPRRRIVIAVSLLGFAVVGGWSGWKLWGATVRRRRIRGQLPPFV